MAEGVGTGIGIGIGNALSGIAEGLKTKYQRENEEREKQAEALHTKGLGLAHKLIEKGHGVKVDPQSGPMLVDAQGNPVQNPPQDVSQLFSELVNTSKQGRELYRHDPNALVEHFKKFMGRQPGQTTYGQQSAQFAPESLTAEAQAGQPSEMNEFVTKMRQAAQAYKLQNPNATDQEANKFGFDQVFKSGTGLKPQGAPIEGTSEGRPAMLQEFISPEGEVTTKPIPGVTPTEATPKAPTAKKVGESFVISDPNTGKEYGPGNINEPSTPADIRSMYEGFQKDEQAKKDAAEKKEADRVREAEARQNKQFEHQDRLEAERIKNSFDQKDYAEGEAARKNADTKYQAALGLSRFADDALKHPEAATDKLLAGRLIRETEGRFNPAQYDNLVKGAGLANTFEQWRNNVASGRLTDTIRQQLVDAAHTFLESAEFVKNSVPAPHRPGEKAPSGPAAAQDPNDPMGILGGKK